MATSVGSGSICYRYYWSIHVSLRPFIEMDLPNKRSARSHQQHSSFALPNCQLAKLYPSVVPKDNRYNNVQQKKVNWASSGA